MLSVATELKMEQLIKKGLRGIKSLFFLMRVAIIDRKFLFAVKTVLALITPGGFGYIRKLRSEEVRTEEMLKNDTDFKPIGQALIGRSYDKYESYLEHQGKKLNMLVGRDSWFNNRMIFVWRLRFFKHFVPLKEVLAKDAKIICVGARQGTEVEVLREIGFRFAIGIDINPGPDNPYVRYGDFMSLDIPDESQDAVYSNAVDHAFDLDSFFKEQARIIRAGGYGLFDFADFQSEYRPGAFEVVAWESTDAPVAVMQKYFSEVISDRKHKGWRTVLAIKQ